MKRFGTIISRIKVVLLLSALGASVLATRQYVHGQIARENAPQTRTENAETRRLLEAFIHASGPDYLDVRDRLASMGPKALSVASEPSPPNNAAEWNSRLSYKVLALWVANAPRCREFHNTLEVWYRRSYNTASGKPSEGRITWWCRKQGAANPDYETLMLERLFKYHDDPHVQVGIVKALGAVGTEVSLDPLIALMNSTDGPCAQCAASVANISRRLGDTRAVRDLLKCYRTRPRRYGTGFPEEVLRALPPWPQVALASALRTIGGEEALQGLQELREKETHPALRQQLEDAIMDLRERLERPDSGQPERTNRDKRGNPELGDE
ncbi:MAG: hypothetical protein JSU86_06680 [Phycisphaerales bacterium]|nr:MAG: hypothetical protein JSU86_06680 [Phycisphaerales bacterium]